MLCWHFCFSDIFKHRLISLTNSPPTTSTSVVEPSSILRKVQNNIFLLLNPAVRARLIPRTIGRILFRHKFPQHGANLANFIVPHFPRIYSLIQGVGRGQLILTLAIVHHRQPLDLGEVGFQAKKTPSAQEEKMLFSSKVCWTKASQWYWWWWPWWVWHLRGRTRTCIRHTLTVIFPF